MRRASDARGEHEALLVEDIALIHDDPPYGVRLKTAMRISGRSNGTTLTHGGNPIARDYPAVAGDEAAFDPSPILALDRRSVIWGGHLCAPALPRSTSWITWDKRDGTGADDNGDDEMAWTNLGGPIRRFTHLWRGTCRASETGTMHLGPCQKPAQLSLWIFQERAKLNRGDLVFVPHGGTGPDLTAARAMGLRVVAYFGRDAYSVALDASEKSSVRPLTVGHAWPIVEPMRTTPAFPLVTDAKSATKAFGLLADALEQRDTILAEVDSAIRATMLLSVLGDIAQASALLMPLASDAAARGARHARKV